MGQPVLRPRRSADVRQLAAIVERALEAQAELVELLVLERVQHVDGLRAADLTGRLRTLAREAGQASAE